MASCEYLVFKESLGTRQESGRSVLLQAPVSGGHLCGLRRICNRRTADGGVVVERRTTRQLPI